VNFTSRRFKRNQLFCLNTQTPISAFGQFIG